MFGKVMETIGFREKNTPKNEAGGNKYIFED